MCDTMVATRNATADGSVILAKNSDREPNEVQPLEHYPAVKQQKEKSLECTYITIPQMRATNEILISRPFWMWGCEMGVNEFGLAIGNEAVFTKEKVLKRGLTGMDMIRLALERTRTADDALSLITEMLERYGQGGNCGYRHKLYYHNSFILADKKTAWVLETAGRHWAAQRVDGVRSISNGLTIGENFDRSSKGIEDYARARGYMPRHTVFNFRDAFSDTVYTHFSRCKIRQSRTSTLLGARHGAITPAIMINILRDHGHDDSYPHPYATHMGTVCMHASCGPFRASQSTAAMVAHLRSKLPVCWATGTSGTCTGIFKPLYFTGEKIDYLDATAEKKYSPGALWWRHERLHRDALRKYAFWGSKCAPERDTLEKKFQDSDAKLHATIEKKKTGAAAKVTAFSRECFKTAEESTRRWLDMIAQSGAKDRLPFFYARFWKSQSKAASMPNE